MTRKSGAGRTRLVGSKQIRRYLRERHGIDIGRTKLWKMSVKDDPSRFPADAVTYLDARRVVAYAETIDAWVRVHVDKK